jgi:hypothetical protein
MTLLEELKEVVPIGPFSEKARVPLGSSASLNHKLPSLDKQSNQNPKLINSRN